MNNFSIKIYRDYVYNKAPKEYRDDIKECFIAIAVITACFILAMLYFKQGVDWKLQIAVLISGLAIYLTYLPIFSVLLLILGTATLLFGLVTGQSEISVLILIVGVYSFVCTSRLYKAYERYENDGTIDLNYQGFVFGSTNRGEKVKFIAKSSCENCGGDISVTRAKRGIITNELITDKSWDTFCQNCVKGGTINKSKAKKLALENNEYAVFKSADRSTVWLVLCVISIAISVTSLIISYSIIHSNTVLYADDIVKNGIRTDVQFVAENVELIDCFSVETSGDWNEDTDGLEAVQAIHLIAYFESDDERILIPVRIASDKDLFETCVQYLTDMTVQTLVINLHGYITALSEQQKSMYNSLVQKYGDYFSSVDRVIDSEEINYWDSSSEPLMDASSGQFNLISVISGISAVICFALDIYMNSSIKSNRAQYRYNKKHKIKSD